MTDAPEELEYTLARAIFEATPTLTARVCGKSARAVLAVPAIADALAARAELAELRQAVWDAYGILGFDQDGDPTPPGPLPMPNFVRSFATEERAERQESDQELHDCYETLGETRRILKLYARDGASLDAVTAIGIVLNPVMEVKND